MSNATPRGFDLDTLRPSRATLLWGALLVNTELILLVAYAVLSDNRLLGPASVRYWLYPFIWINVGLWAVIRTTPAPTTPRKRRLAAALAVGYFLVLAYAGGLVGAGHGTGTLRVVTTSIPPGWGPAVLYGGSLVSLTLIPYKLAGYLALAYLVYATVIDAAGSAVSGVLGLLSCVSCTWPVIASIATGVLGSGSALAGAAYSQSYGLSTVVFVVTVALLYWRPFGR